MQLYMKVIKTQTREEIQNIGQIHCYKKLTLFNYSRFAITFVGKLLDGSFASYYVSSAHFENEHWFLVFKPCLWQYVSKIRLFFLSCEMEEYTHTDNAIYDYRYIKLRLAQKRHKQVCMCYQPIMNFVISFWKFSKQSVWF